MKKITLNLLVIVFTIVSFNAQNTNKQKADKQKADNYLATNGEVCFTFQANSVDQFKEIAKFLSIGHKHVSKKDLIAEAYGNKKTFAKFLEYGLPYQVNKSDNELPYNLHEAGKSPEAILAKSKNSKMMAAWDTTWDAYPTYLEYVAKMQYYAATYPNICSLETIGTTQSGRELLVLKITDNVSINEGEPEFLYTSSMHGDELVGFPLMMRLIDYILTNYGTDSEVTDLVNSTEIYINPSANPDGSYRLGDTNQITNPRRQNDSGQDLNRNYPDNAEGLHYSGTYEDETLAFMNYANSKNFVLSANFHGGTELVNYPYDNADATSQYTHADTDYFEYISVEYATNAQNNSPSGYMTVDDDSHYIVSPGVTHGAEWYQVYGGRQDYMNYYKGTKEVTIELSDIKWVDGADLPAHWNYNKQAFLDYIKQANYGIHGTITDESGNPIVARIEIIGHDKLNTFRMSESGLGEYQKLLNTGVYNVTYSAPGYIPQTISVSVTNNLKTIQNVTLVATTAKPTASDDQLCDSGTTILNATGSGTLNWYDDKNATASIFTGASFTTPSLTSTTSYFVEDVISKANVGSTSTSSNGSNFTSTGRYLVFDCDESVTLEQVTVNANSAGEIEVELQDSTGNILNAAIVFVNAGVQTIDLNFIIPIDDDLRLVCKNLTTGGLYRNNSGVSYPYDNGSISIKNSSAGTGFYYFFYDWKIGSLKSARKEVVVTVDPSPTANFTYVVNPLNNGEVTFTNTSNDATSYSWDFGDSIGTSTSTNPTYTFLETNTFDVVLTSTNAECGNDMITIQVNVTSGTLDIENNELSKTTVYPNPFSDNISINLADYNSNADLDILLFDINGRTIFNESRNNNKIVNISNLNSLQQGVYFLKITNTENGESTVKQIAKH